MSTEFHTALPVGYTESAAVMNPRLSDLDSAIVGIKEGKWVEDAATTEIATNAITQTTGYHILQAETGTADVLETITPITGAKFIVVQADTGDTITLDNGTGNLSLGGSDITLSGDTLAILYYDGTTWLLVAVGREAQNIDYAPDESDHWIGTDPDDVAEGLDRAIYQKGQYWIEGYDVNVASTTVVTVTPGECVDDTYTALMADSASQSIDVTTSGANGLDTGAIAADTWYYVFIIKNPTSNDVAGLVSLSATAPTLPSGYVDQRRVGAVRTDSGTLLYLQTTQPGGGNQREVIYDEDTAAGDFRILTAQNLSTAPTWDVEDCSAVIPPTSRKGKFGFASNPGGISIISWRIGTNDSHTLMRGELGSAGGGIFELPVDSAQAIDLTGSAAQNEALDMEVIGYVDNLLDSVVFRAT